MAVAVQSAGPTDEDRAFGERVALPLRVETERARLDEVYGVVAADLFLGVLVE